MTGVLVMWTIYDHPTDFPHYYVARKWEIGHGPEPVKTESVIFETDLTLLRTHLAKRGYTCLPRDESDEPQIVETWL